MLPQEKTEVFTVPSVIEHWWESMGENNLLKQGWIDGFLFFVAIKNEALVLRNYSYTCLRTVPIGVLNICVESERWLKLIRIT